MTDLAVFILRLAIGVVFSGHGLQKAFGLFGGPGINAFSGMLSGLGFAPALLWAYAVAYIELIAGVFLIAGLFTRVSSLLLILSWLWPRSKSICETVFFCRTEDLNIYSC